MAALQALGVAKDSPLWKSEQIPYLTPPPPIQSQVGADDDEDTLSMRDLVQAIDSHVEMYDLEASSNIHVEARDAQNQTPPALPSVKEMPIQPAPQTPPSSPAV